MRFYNDGKVKGGFWFCGGAFREKRAFSCFSHQHANASATLAGRIQGSGKSGKQSRKEAQKTVKAGYRAHKGDLVNPLTGN